MPKPIFVENLSKENSKKLTYLVNASDKKLGKRAKIILLSNQGYTISEISKNIGIHYQNVRKWIYRFSENGINGLYHRNKGKKNKLKYETETRNKIIKTATLMPKNLGLSFTKWTLKKLKEYFIDKKITEKDIAIETIRNILITNGINWKKREKYNTSPTNGVTIHFDNKGRTTTRKYKEPISNNKKEIIFIEQEITTKEETTLFANYNPLTNKLIVRLQKKI